jgi:hypothetical protein
MAEGDTSWRLAVVLCLQVYMQKLNRQGTFAYRSGYSLDGLVPDITGREDARHACFEQERRALQRPAIRLARSEQVGAGEDESLIVPRHAIPEPSGVRLGPDHHE